tara:strand:- start:134 stop:466 length:333 start_codon:yes stop_codon:yes gene_type:complete
MFLSVDRKSFTSYHMNYTFNISKIVLPLMVIELFFVIEMLINNYNLYSLISFILIIVVWLSTFFIQVPLHNSLSKKYSELKIKKLIFSNWIRTFSWLIKLIVLFYLGEII